MGPGQSAGGLSPLLGWVPSFQLLVLSWGWVSVKHNLCLDRPCPLPSETGYLEEGAVGTWEYVHTRGWHVGVTCDLLCVVYFSLFLFQLSLATLGLPGKMWNQLNVNG